MALCQLTYKFLYHFNKWETINILSLIEKNLQKNSTLAIYYILPSAPGQAQATTSVFRQIGLVRSHNHDWSLTELFIIFIFVHLPQHPPPFIPPALGFCTAPELGVRAGGHSVASFEYGDGAMQRIFASLSLKSLVLGILPFSPAFVGMGSLPNLCEVKYSLGDGRGWLSVLHGVPEL